MQSSAFGVSVAISLIILLLFSSFAFAQKKLPIDSNQPRPAGWSEKDWQEWRDFVFDYDWAKTVWDSWPNTRFRQKLIEDCGYRFHKEKVHFRGDKITGIKFYVTSKNTKPGTFAHWHQANRSEWQKYKNLANQLPDDPDELLKAIAKIDKLTVEQREGLNWHFKKGTPAQSILEYRPEDMDVEYFKTCHDIYIIMALYQTIVDNIFRFPKDALETVGPTGIRGYKWDNVLNSNIFYDSIYNIPDWFSDDIAEQLKTTYRWKYMRQD